MQRNYLAALSATFVLLLVLASMAQAFHFHRHRSRPAALPAPVGNPYAYGGVIPKYGYDPHIAPNPYPWGSPAMPSGFRHYHVLPAPPVPPGPHGEGPFSEVVPLVPPGAEQLPKPRNLP
jgi:hypothetical protein